MPQLPVISGKDFIKFLQTLGFIVVRINGSHHRLKHPDGRVTTVPVHKNEDLPKGLMRNLLYYPVFDRWNVQLPKTEDRRQLSDVCRLV